MEDGMVFCVKEEVSRFGAPPAIEWVVYRFIGQFAKPVNAYASWQEMVRCHGFLYISYQA